MESVSFGVVLAMTRSDGRFAAGVTPDDPVFGRRGGVRCMGAVAPAALDTPPGGVVDPRPVALAAAAPAAPPLTGGAMARRGGAEGGWKASQPI